MTPLPKRLAMREFGWHYSDWVISGALLVLFDKMMRGIFARYRAVSVASIMILLLGVVALSTASRRPCLHACSGAWHTYKASHMTESGQHQSSVTPAAESAENYVTEIQTSPRHYVPHHETLPIPLPLALQEHHFRSPPYLDQDSRIHHLLQLNYWQGRQIGFGSQILTTS